MRLIQPRSSYSSGLSCVHKFLEASAASVHQLITLRTLRTLREISVRLGTAERRLIRVREWFKA